MEPKLKVLGLRTAESTDWTLDTKTFNTALREGHNNLPTMLDGENIEVIKLFVDYLDEAPEIVRKLPKFDLIYNAMTDADRCVEALEKADKLCEKLGVPVMNEPQAILKTTREGNYQRFKDNPDIILPESVRIDDVQGDCLPPIMATLEEHGFEYPVIVRVSGFQNGKYTHKVEDIEKHDFSEINELLREQPRSLYVSQYCDVGLWDERAPEHAIYPKYRAFFVGGELYPTHVRYGYGEWNVHMPQSAPTYKKFPWLYDLARDYLEDPLSHFDERLWSSLKEVMSSLELDYVGVDFAVSTAPGKEGKLVIFEANASMRSFLLDTHSLVPEHEAARRVISAAHDVMVNKAGVERWDYQMPKGKSSPGEEWLVSDDEVVTVEVKVKGDIFDSGFGEWVWHECYKHHLDAKIFHENGVVESFYAKGAKIGVEAFLVAMSQWCEKEYQFANSQCEEAVEHGVRFI